MSDSIKFKGTEDLFHVAQDNHGNASTRRGGLFCADTGRVHERRELEQAFEKGFPEKMDDLLEAVHGLKRGGPSAETEVALGDIQSPLKAMCEAVSSSARGPARSR